MAAGARFAAVHPHVCGERAETSLALARVIGSSPRVWGTAHQGVQNAGQFRFIPTCVGNGIHLTNQKLCLAVHPHVCGERHQAAPSSIHWSGSSPRVWGTAERWASKVIKGRFIPTCVGNGLPWANVAEKITVHPHVCGERAETSLVLARVIGSSPRVWGTGRNHEKTLSWLRFIPTCVGNGGKLVQWIGGRTVHPHVCGERHMVSHRSRCPSGSSPRVWGTGDIDKTLIEGLRFIPTCVGNGLGPFLGPRVGMVHPHVCGERVLQSPVPQPPVGSSPRVWGTAWSLPISPHGYRFIPTCVGNG